MAEVVPKYHNASTEPYRALYGFTICKGGATQASAFFAAEEATREKRLGPIDAHKHYLPEEPKTHACQHCGRETKRRGLCDACLKKGLTTARVCANCGKPLKKRRYYADQSPMYCKSPACQYVRDQLRHPKYHPTIKGEHIERTNPCC